MSDPFPQSLPSFPKQPQPPARTPGAKPNWPFPTPKPAPPYPKSPPPKPLPAKRDVPHWYGPGSGS